MKLKNIGIEKIFWLSVVIELKSIGIAATSATGYLPLKGSNEVNLVTSMGIQTVVFIIKFKSEIFFIRLKIFSASNEKNPINNRAKKG